MRVMVESGYLKLFKRAEEYLENIINSDSTWEEKNKRLKERGILWEIDDQDENDEDWFVGIESVFLCNDCPYTNINLLTIE